MKTLRLLVAGAALAFTVAAHAAETAADNQLRGLRMLAEAGKHEIAIRGAERATVTYPNDPRFPRIRTQLLEGLARELGAAGRNPLAAVFSRSARTTSPLVSHARAEAGRDFTTETAAVTMVWIASGTFLMSATHGSDDDTRVTLSRGYWLGRTEVTQEQWQAVMEHIPVPSLFKGSDRPVERVSWVSAMEFCHKLNERERAAGRLPEGYDFTLPTEAQWEYACRAGTTGSFAGDIDAMGWHEMNSGQQTHPVAQKKPNAWGLYDMHGNVVEWCLDGLTGYPGGTAVDWRGDYTGPSAATLRIVRGGGWALSAGLCRSAYRNSDLLNGTSSNSGFRVALAPRLSSLAAEQPPGGSR